MNFDWLSFRHKRKPASTRAFEPGMTLQPGESVTAELNLELLIEDQALLAAEKLFKDGVEAEVIHVPTIKPLDTETILKSVRKTGAVVTAEEGQIIGGLGGAIAELLAEEHPAPLKRVGMLDRFGESGSPDQLLEHFGLDAKHIRLATHIVLAKKPQPRDKLKRISKTA